MRPLALTIAGLVSLTAAGCHRLESKRAVQSAIEEHLKQRPGLALENMTMEVEDVKFSGQTAEARVKFQSRQAPQSFVEVRYTLRQADGRWEVESSAPLGGMGSHRGASGVGSAAPPGTAATAPQPAPSH